MKNLFFFVIVILLFIGCTSKEIDYINLKFGESPFVFDSIFHQNQGHKTFVFYKGRKFSDIATEKYGNGQLMYKIEFKDGLANGPVEEYYLNGKNKIITTFQKGHVINVFKEYYENGNLNTLMSVNSNGLKEGTETDYYEDGSKWVISSYKDGLKNGSEIEYFQNGKVNQIINFKEGEREGVVKKWYENGNFEAQSMFSKDKQNGVFLEIFKDSTRARGTYKDDVIDGVVEFYDKDDRLTGKTYYVKGKQVSSSNSSYRSISTNKSENSKSNYRFSVVGFYISEDNNGPVNLNGVFTYFYFNIKGLIFMGMGTNVNEVFSDPEGGIVEGRIKVGSYTLDNPFIYITWKGGNKGKAKWEYIGSGTIRCGETITLKLIDNQ